MCDNCGYSIDPTNHWWIKGAEDYYFCSERCAGAAAENMKMITGLTAGKIEHFEV
ncbi:hypothetical protein [Lactovum odontotermitis]